MDQRVAKDDGFTVVEAAVALALSIVVFAALTTSVTAALNGSRENRHQQIATGIAMSHVEMGRALDWATVAMEYVDSESPVLDAGGTSVDGSIVGLPTDEALVVDMADGMVAPRAEEVADGVTYTVWCHVTDAGSLRRLIVVVTWNVGDSTRLFQTSTLISQVSSR